MSDTEPVHVHSDCMKVSQVLSRLGDKWSILVIMLLRERARRFSELKRGIEGVSQRMLTLTLRNLERDGLVNRTVTPSIPPRVDYELTSLGHSLAEPVQALGTWAFANIGELSEAQARYDAKELERAPAAQGCVRGFPLRTTVPGQGKSPAVKLVSRDGAAPRRGA